MLDADEYPRAFLDFGRFRIEFRDAHTGKKNDGLEARVTIYER